MLFEVRSSRLLIISFGRQPFIFLRDYSIVLGWLSLSYQPLSYKKSVVFYLIDKRILLSDVQFKSYLLCFVMTHMNKQLKILKYNKIHNKKLYAIAYLIEWLTKMMNRNVNRSTVLFFSNSPRNSWFLIKKNLESKRSAYIRLFTVKTQKPIFIFTTEGLHRHK